MNRIGGFILCGIALLFQVATADAASPPERDLKGLIIHGQNFWFTISEPEGWTVNIDDATARELNAYFTIAGYTYDTSPGLIYIRVMGKEGLSVEENLKADMDNFAQRKTVKFRKFEAPGIRYHYAAMEYMIDDRTRDYLCYVDPGRTFKTYLIFVLSTDIQNSTKHLRVFQQLLSSFTWGGDQVK